MSRRKWIHTLQEQNEKITEWNGTIHKHKNNKNKKDDNDEHLKDNNSRKYINNMKESYTYGIMKYIWFFST